jgi:hypothetical protein
LLDMSFRARSNACGALYMSFSSAALFEKTNRRKS